MRQQDYFHNKHVLIIGLAKSGYAAAKLLHSLGAKVIVNDRSSYNENLQTVSALEKLGIQVVCGGHPLSLLEQPLDFIVKNPGIPYTNPLIAKAIKQEIPVITEVEIAGMISQAPIVSITGSNGKTTTTTLIGEMLQDDIHRPRVAGNIGTVLCEVAAEASKEDTIIAELSSFQLMGIRNFHPSVAIFLNLFDAHLDYHGTKEAYGMAKANIFQNQTGKDYLIYNMDDDEVVQLVEKAQATKIPFSISRIQANGVYIKNDTFYFQKEPIIHLSDIVLPGKHNLENIAAAIGATKVLGGSNERIREVLTTFTGVKHRLQYVDSINGIKFYNDSKATNILATQKAIQAFQQPVLLLAGGLDRGNGFDELIPHFKNVKALITFGETAPKMIDTARKAGMKRIEHVDNVEDAVPKALEMAEAGDVILLSPACASWDQYKTFEERGDIFIQSVHRLKTGV